MADGDIREKFAMWQHGDSSDDALEEEQVCLLLLLAEERRRKRRKRRWSVQPLNSSRTTDGEFYTLVQEMRDTDEEKHRRYFCMSAVKFDELVRRITPFTSHKNTHSNPVLVPERLAVTLRYLASGESLHSLSHSYRLGARTVSTIVPEVCEALWKSLQPEFVAVPTTETQWRSIAEDFWRVWSFPLCVGAIDGKRVHAGKETQSVVLLAACDAHYRFTMVDVGAYGRESDGGVFKESEFGSRITDCTLGLPSQTTLPGTNTTSPYVFVGDAAFPLRQNLMRPYSGNNLTDEQTVYNYRHCRAHSVMENTFGIMASRWRIFGRPMDCNPSNVNHIVKACVALHNFLTHTDSTNYIPPEHPDTVVADGQVEMGQWRQTVADDTGLTDTQRLCGFRASQSAMLVRDNFKTYFQTPQGAVPWQDGAITAK